MVKKKNEEIYILQDKVKQLQKTNKNSIENEINRLGDLLSDADNNLKEKEREIESLKDKINELSKENLEGKGVLYSKKVDAENESLKKHHVL